MIKPRDDNAADCCATVSCRILFERAYRANGAAGGICPNLTLAALCLAAYCANGAKGRRNSGIYLLLSLYKNTGGKKGLSCVSSILENVLRGQSDEKKE